MESPYEFDATKGGSEHLPFSANSWKFASSRSVEIAAMTESIMCPSKVKLIFQSLPVHMRRRVMSHNAKRLPIKFRAGHMDQLKKGGLAVTHKRPSRKYRRRPKNLLEEYTKRQRSKVWLETHIWHAKRFHMIELWGHKLAYAPCDKAFRACYRASSAHCLIQDISYYTPVRVTGPVDLIKEMFSSVTHSSCGLGICAKAFIDGKREGSIHLYEKNSYPFSYIGKVKFIWDNRNSNRVLWLFVHPSQIEQVETTLKDLLCHDVKSDNNEIPEKRRKLCNKFSENIEFKLLPGSYNRFKLTGPKSHAVLVNTLKCFEDFELVKEHKWVAGLNESDLYLKEKHDYWDSFRTAASPSQLPSKIVVGLVIKDPRVSRPDTRRKPLTEYNDVSLSSLLNVPQFVSTSNIWDTTLHDIIKTGNMSNTKFIEHMTEAQWVPGGIDICDPVLQSLPIVLIQQPGSQDANVKKIGYGSGWDIIMPAGYALHFWQTFQMFGARSGGLRETESLAFESGECYMPPDSIAGRNEEQRLSLQAKERYFKLPPSKRVNYMKLGIISPFECPWKILLKDWSTDYNETMFVLRNRQILETLQDCVNRKTELPTIENASSCLVPVYIKMLKRGNIKRNALICLPEKKDIVGDTMFEPQHHDPNENIRKQKKAEHKKDLQKQRKERIKLRKSGNVVNLPKSMKKADVSDYVKSMRELWVPSDIYTVRQSCSRQIMGFLSQAAFSFSEAISCGVGYISFNALDTLLKQKLNQVLVRNTCSRKYRVANISIIKVH